MAARDPHHHRSIDVGQLRTEPHEPRHAVLVLDESTSALDPLSAEDVLASLTRLVDDLGATVLVAENRIERVLGHADRMIWLPGRAEPPRAKRAAHA